MNEGESEEEAVIRETKEEVELDVKPLTKLLERQHPNTLVPIVYFDCEEAYLGQDAGIGEEYEIEEVQWVPASEVLDKFTSDVDPTIQKFIFSFA